MSWLLLLRVRLSLGCCCHGLFNTYTFREASTRQILPQSHARFCKKKIHPLTCHMYRVTKTNKQTNKQTKLDPATRDTSGGATPRPPPKKKTQRHKLTRRSGGVCLTSLCQMDLGSASGGQRRLYLRSWEGSEVVCRLTNLRIDGPVEELICRNGVGSGKNKHIPHPRVMVVCLLGYGRVIWRTMRPGLTASYRPFRSDMPRPQSPQPPGKGRRSVPRFAGCLGRSKGLGSPCLEVDGGGVHLCSLPQERETWNSRGHPPPPTQFFRGWGWEWA